MSNSENMWKILNHVDNKVCQAMCICGKVKLVRTYNILKDKSRSCGCATRSTLVKAGIPLKFSKRLIRIFNAMKQRCYNENAVSYVNYGAKGIEVCDAWLKNSLSFYLWAISSGYTNDLTIDRIDSSLNYSPENCQWISLSENSRKSVSENREKSTGVFSESFKECAKARAKDLFGRKLRLVDCVSGEQILFDCLISAAEYIVEIRALDTMPIQIKKNISACLHGKRKRVHGFYVQSVDVGGQHHEF